MKKIIGILTIAALGTTMSFAQNGNGGGKGKNQPTQEKMGPGAKHNKMEMKSNNKTSEMDEVVNLDEKQKNEIAVINKEQNEKAKAIRMKYSKDESADKSLMQEEIKAVQQERKERVDKVLTPEQNTKWKEHKKAQREEKPNTIKK